MRKGHARPWYARVAALSSVNAVILRLAVDEVQLLAMQYHEKVYVVVEWQKMRW